MLARRAFYFHLRYFLFTLQRLRSAPYLPGPLTDCWGSCSMPSGGHVFHSLRPSAVLDIQLFCFVFMCFLYADWLRLLRLDGQEVKEQVPGTHTRKNLTILISSLSQNMHTHAQTAVQEQPNRQNKNKKKRKKNCLVPCKSFFFPISSNYLCLLSFFTASEQHNNKRSETVQSKTCLVFPFLLFVC